MKKTVSVMAALLTVLFFVVGCSSKSKESSSGLKVGVVTDEGGVKDKSFNQSNAEAVKEWVKANGGKEQNAIETKNHSDIAANLQTASKASDVVSVPGFYFEKDLPKVADSFPNTKYIVLDAVVEKANVQSVLFADEEAGYLAGYTAALQSKTGKIGFIGGAKIPPVVKFGLGYIQGAKAANKNINIVYNYSGTFSDTTKGKTLAATMYDAGVDVIFVAAGGTGSGVIKEAQERAVKDIKDSGEIKTWVIGVDKDQYEDGIFKAKDNNGNEVEKSVVLTSTIKHFDVAVKQVLDTIKNGKFEGGKTKTFTIKEGGVSLPEKNPNLTNDIVDKVNKTIEEIKNDKVHVENTVEKLTDKNNIQGEI